MAFPELPYENLEAPDIREFAKSDPRGFLARHPDGCVIDEFQRCPELTSYIQVLVDDPSFDGTFVLTGSRNLCGTRSETTEHGPRPGAVPEVPWFVRRPEQIAQHPLRGMLFENLVVVEVMKHFLNRGMRPDLMFYRDSNGNEVDLVLGRAQESIPMEIKSAQTVTGSLLKGLGAFRRTIASATDPVLVYGGEETRTQHDTRIAGLSSLDETLTRLFPS